MQIFGRTGILKESKVCEKVLTFGPKNPEADVYGYEIQKDGHETVFTVKDRAV